MSSKKNKELQKMHAWLKDSQLKMSQYEREAHAERAQAMQQRDAGNTRQAKVHFQRYTAIHTKKLAPLEAKRLQVQKSIDLVEEQEETKKFYKALEASSKHLKKARGKAPDPSKLQHLLEGTEQAQDDYQEIRDMLDYSVVSSSEDAVLDDAFEAFMLEDTPEVQHAALPDVPSTPVGTHTRRVSHLPSSPVLEGLYS